MQLSIQLLGELKAMIFEPGSNRAQTNGTITFKEMMCMNIFHRMLGL